MSADGAVHSRVRSMPIWSYLVLVVAYLVAIQTLPRLTQPAESTYGQFETVAEVTRGLWVTVGLGSLFVLVTTAYLRWWRPVFLEEPSHRLPRWVWVFPGAMLVCIVVGTNYSRLFDQGAEFVATFLVGSLLIGLSEEGMFRGLGLVTFREAGLSEGWVALWTCVLFGLAHSTNLFAEGPTAFAQVLVTAVAGYFFYLTRRVSGGLLLPIVVHGLWDMGLFTNTIDRAARGVGLGTFLFILVDLVLLVTAIVTFRKVWPKRPEHDR